MVTFISVGSSVAQVKITLEDLWLNRTFVQESLPGFNFLADGRHYTLKKSGQIQSYDITTGQMTEVIFDPQELSQAMGFKGKSYSYTFSSDEGMILLAEQRSKLYRRSYLANYYIYNRSNGTISPLFDNGKVMNAHFSPQGDKIGFVFENNIYYRDLKSQNVVQVTMDGQINEVINGAADWVYEEEFAITRTFEWSADGRYMTFIRFDESEVKEFTMTNYNNQLYPDYQTFKYPKVGEKNAEVSVLIYDTAKKTTTEVDLDYSDFYIPRIQWTHTDNQLCVTVVNRHQNELSLILVDPQNAKTKLLLKENNEYYIDVHDNLKFLKDGQHFVWTSEKEGYNQLYLYNMKGQQVSKITKGDYDVTNVYGVDEEREKIFFQASKLSPLQREVYSVNYNGSELTAIQDSTGWNDCQFSTTFDYYVHNYSNKNSPSQYIVFDNRGQNIRSIVDNAALKQRLEKFDFQSKTFFTFKNRVGDDLNGYLITPPDFDENKEYPLFTFLYGGPGSQQVVDAWGGLNFAWFQMLAQKGYIVACIDNRGTGGRGEKFKKMTYLNLGKYETEDQIDGVRYLASLPYVDGSRIGVFGWSYGGYMSTNLILHGNDVYKMAIAVAPVTNWRWYDTIYTERYMRNEKENEKGYHDYSPVYFANKLKGKYLLVHGLSDDNVHFQHTAEMAAALVKEGKDFEAMFYPNNSHSISGPGARLHLYRKMTNFILNNL
ncbi:S9 family peptidase [Membranihabitans marinus]